MDISEIQKVIEQDNLGVLQTLVWQNPEDITGLDDNTYSDEDLSDVLFDYYEICYKQGESCLPKDHPYTLTESYIRVMIYLIIEHNSSLAATSVPPPENVTSFEAKKCLPFFMSTLLNRDLLEHTIDTIQMYICDFYQYDDLWEPPDGRFYHDLTKSENLLIDFLGKKDLCIGSLKTYGIPREILPLVAETKLIMKALH